MLDIDGLLALERFAEQTIQLSESAADVPIILGNLRKASDRRLAEVHPDDEARVAFAEAHQDAATVAAVAGRLDLVRTPATAAETMVTATHLIHPLGTLPEGPPSTVEQLDNVLAAVRGGRPGGSGGGYDLAVTIPE